MRPIVAQARSRLVGVVGVTMLVACGTPQVRPKLEDKPRRIVPLPACVMRLPPRKSGSVAARAITEEQYWKLVFPEFDLGRNELPERALACTGDAVLDDPALKGGKSYRIGWPLHVQEGDAVFGSGGDKLRVVWLRSHRFDDGTVGGALALTRITEDFAEVYGVGAFRGNPEKTRLGVERLGSEVLATAQDEGCVGRKPNEPCETRLNLFVTRRGVLHEVAELSLERVEYTFNTEPGALGRMEYHLTSTPKYLPTGIKVMEQVQVLDEKKRPLRKAELERVYTLNGEKPMQQSDDPLWPRVFPKNEKSAAPVASTAPTPKKK